MNTETLKEAIIEENSEEVREHVKSLVQESIIEASENVLSENANKEEDEDE